MVMLMTRFRVDSWDFPGRVFDVFYIRLFVPYFFHGSRSSQVALLSYT